MSALGPTLPIWVQGVNEFQQLGLINQATMCALGVDVPFVAFSKNKTERQERLFRSFLILFLAFGLAPIHSTALARHCQHSISKSKSLSAQDKRDLFQLNYKKLLDTPTFQASIAQELPHLKQHANEALRLAVLKAKGNHFSTDLAIEGGLLASVGLIKILFGRLLTGDNQFTGEKELASQKDLNLLYKKEQGEKPKGLPHLASYLTIGSAMTLPFLFGKSLQKAMMSTNETPHGFRKNCVK